MELLRVENLKKTYSSKLGLVQCHALKGMSFTVEEGEFLAIMGASGSGKTTLLNILATLDKPTSGTVKLDGRDIAEIKDKQKSEFRRDKLGFVFQDFNLLDTFTVKDNILLPLVLSQTPLKEMERRIQPIAESLGIEKLLSKYPYEISGGEKQRTAIARAVITEPRLLLADEPTGALDSKASASLLTQFTALNEAGRTMIMVTHSTMAASYAKRVMLIQDGEIYSQLYRGDDDRRTFHERVVNSLSVLSEGGEKNA